MLKLFNAPCVVEDAPYREATGHCSHMTTHAIRRCCMGCTADESWMLLSPSLLATPASMRTVM